MSYKHLRIMIQACNLGRLLAFEDPCRLYCIEINLLPLSCNILVLLITNSMFVRKRPQRRLPFDSDVFEGRWNHLLMAQD